MSRGSSLVPAHPTFAPTRQASATNSPPSGALASGDPFAGHRRERRAAPQFEKVGAVAARYMKYLALFVGAGLISGSVVHFPLAPVRYTIIGTIGAALFAIASVLAERSERGPGGLVRVAISALALALGIGMISGSIQHFQDIPDRAATLIPVGIVLSLAAFVVRNAIRVRRDQLTACFAVVVVFAAVLFVGLQQLAGRVDVAAADHHGAATSESSTTSKSSALGGNAVNRPEASSTGAAAAGEKHADDGHGH